MGDEQTHTVRTIHCGDKIQIHISKTNIACHGDLWFTPMVSGITTMPPNLRYLTKHYTTDPSKEETRWFPKKNQQEAFSFVASQWLVPTSHPPVIARKTMHIDDAQIP